MIRQSTVKLLMRRELIDQFRDRRTLLTVFVMPLMLYPVLGIVMLQLASFFRETPSKVMVIGGGNLVDFPIIEGNQLLPAFAASDGGKLISLMVDNSPLTVQRMSGILESQKSGDIGSGAARKELLSLMQSGKADLLVVIPRPYEVLKEGFPDPGKAMTLLFDSSRDSHRIAAGRWNGILGLWQRDALRKVLNRDRVVGAGSDESQSGVKPVPSPTVRGTIDLSGPKSGSVSTWAKILPLLVMVWCLTGAFYPAIDLCAGEKERGTLETLLSSPATRTEIAIGKLVTVMVFSIATSLLNLVSMGMTAMLLMANGSIAGIGGLFSSPPPIHAVLLVIVAAIPASAIFGSLSLAAAAFARSSKEGQYYLIPLIMVGMPLLVVPMLPSVQLDMGTSLIPVTGLMLLFRSMIEGNWSAVAMYSGPVLVVSMACCTLAIRWVVHQFNTEEILFRPSDRHALSAWVRSVFRSRECGLSPGHAIVCGLMILLVKFGSGRLVSSPSGWNEFAMQTFVLLVVSVGVPALLMAVVLTSRPLNALLLTQPRISHLAMAAALAVCLQPGLSALSSTLLKLYPMDESVVGMAAGLISVINDAPSLLALVVLFAIVPAVLEEVAYRGFILSGFRSMARPFVAVLLTSLLFGMAHGIIQQSINAAVVGMLLGLIAVRTGSVFPCIAFHAMHNGLAIWFSQWNRYGMGNLEWLVDKGTDGGYGFTTAPTALLSVCGSVIVLWLLKPQPQPGESSRIQSQRGSGVVNRIATALNSWFPRQIRT